MLVVQCPKCKAQQRTNPKNLSTAVKRCVFCGKSFKVLVPANHRIIGLDRYEPNEPIRTIKPLP